ncbi:MAG: UvrD-helicase domain-containing protein, partial [Chloroflexota bacterium]|nr:UvrD-helicase domain-containing protein [Chloroflexota bacterium]
ASPLWQAPDSVRSAHSAQRIPQSVEARLAAQGLEVLRLPPSDPMLGGARAVFDREFVAYDESLPLPAVAFSLAHELGHTLLHGGAGGCAADDIDEAWAIAPATPGGVEVYSPRQEREREANAFAAAFLMPPAELRAGFVAGLSYTALATRYGVSETAVLNALAATLLVPVGGGSGIGGRGSDDGPEPSSTQPATRNPQPAAEGSGIGGQGSDDKPELPSTQHSTLNTQHLTLDESQAAAATVAAGPVLVDAGPGTGKTRTLIERVAHLLRRGVEPEAILALTFSNKAAAEMRERLRGSAPAAADRITVGTFHAFCLQFLHDHAAAAGLPPDLRLVDDVQAVAWLEPHLADLRLDHYGSLHDPAYRLPDILGAISRARDELADATRYADIAATARATAPSDDPQAQALALGWTEVACVYARYEQVLAERGALDFGGLLLHTVRLLESRPALLAELQGRYAEILVDEYQDMNRASGVLLSLLAGTGRGLWVVGDLRQAIYRFRGASPANLTEWERDFPGGRRLRLDVNYRSDPNIVGLFATLGAAMPLSGAPPAWTAHRPAGTEPQLWLAEADDNEAEAQGILHEIRRRHAAGRPLRDQVVLCRTHGQAAGIARALEAAAVPTLYLGNLFERPEVRDLLAVVALAAGEGNALLRAARLTGHPLDRAACAALLTHARSAELSFPRALEAAAAAGLDESAVAACTALAAAISEAGSFRTAAPFLARILFGPLSPVRAALAAGAGAAARLLAARNLLDLARSSDALDQSTAPPSPAGTDTASTDAASSAPTAVTDNATPSTQHSTLNTQHSTLAAFLTQVRRLYAAKEGVGRAADPLPDLDAVRVLTVHASKGLEFPVVYLPGLAAGRFPFKKMWEPCPIPPGLIRDGDPSDQLLEETCLFFVALSRARDELVISRAARYGKQSAKRSPLLDPLDPYFAAHPPQRLHWAAAALPAEDDAPPLAPAINEPLTLTVEALELYLRCPRQYEYSRLWQFDRDDEKGSYQRFHGVVHGQIQGLRDAHRRGALPGDEAAVLETLTAAWTADGPQGHPHEAIYAEAARGLVLGTWHRLAAITPDTPWHNEVAVQINGATVRARLDLAAHTPQAGVRVVRVRTGKPNDEDRKSPRLALLRRAAEQVAGSGVPVTIELEYLQTGETIEVPDTRYEAARIEKYERAVAGIRAAHFPPTPAEADACLRCPFWIICPT